MARLKVASTDEELSSIPRDQEVLVELPNIIPDDDDEGLAPPRKEAKDDKKVTDEVEVDPTVDSLNKQIDALKEAEKATKNSLEAERRSRLEAERIANEKAAEANQFRTEAQSQYANRMKAALDASQSENEAATKDYATAMENGDFKAAAEAQNRMSRTAARIVESERILANIDVAEEEEKVRQERQPPRQQPVDFSAAVDSNPQFMDSEKKFLKEHPELLLDPKKNNELSVAYDRAMSAGLSRGSPKYFEFIEKFMGYKKDDTSLDSSAEDDDNDPQQPVAPVDRKGGAGSPQRPTQVKLTKEQRQAAADIGISEVEYARNLLKLQKEKILQPGKYS